MTSYSIAEANSKFAQIVREAEAGKPVELTRRGQAVAVVMSAQDYATLKRRRSKLKTLAQLREQYNMAKYGLSDDEVAHFNNRDKSPGRDFSFEE